MRIALGIEYEGTHYHGWQWQLEAPSVQQRLEQALSKIANHTVRVHCAGRTDSGVHAVNQVVHFDTSAERSEHVWLYGTNSQLPADIKVRWVQAVTQDFHARFTAKARRYIYILYNDLEPPVILRQQCAWHRTALNIEAMQTAVKMLIGQQDFSCFRAAGCQAKTAIRTMHEANVTARGPFIFIELFANAFLYHMVRNVVGSLILVGEGLQKPTWFQALLDGADRTQAGVTASAAGLHFVEVGYPAEFASVQEKISQRLAIFKSFWLNANQT